MSFFCLADDLIVMIDYPLMLGLHRSVLTFPNGQTNGFGRSSEIRLGNEFIESPSP